MFAIPAFSPSFVGPAMPSKVARSRVVMDGKGFGGGKATRDSAPTTIDPNDPKGKQQAIFKAESFADYLARRNGGSAPAAAAPPAAAPRRTTRARLRLRPAALVHREELSGEGPGVQPVG